MGPYHLNNRHIKKRSFSFVEAAKIISKTFGYPVTKNKIWYTGFVENISDRKAIPDTIQGLMHEITRGEMAEIIHRLEKKITTKKSLFFDKNLNILTLKKAENQEHIPIAHQKKPEPKTGQIVLQITGLENNQGQLRVALFNTSAGFPENDEQAYRRLEVQPENRKGEIIFTELPFGEYALAIFHDENNDKILNKNLFGTPQEKYGFSSEWPIRATYDEVKFSLKDKKLSLEIELKW